MNSTLPVFYSKENLTSRFADYSNVYVLPPVCVFGVVTNLICILVSSRRNITSPNIVDYILINSCIDCSFLLIESFLFIIRCGSLCPYGFTYAAKFYEIYIFLYVGYVLVTSQMLLNIYVSWDRLRIFSGKLSSQQKRLKIYQVYVIFVLISVIANAFPYLVAKEVVPIGIYALKPNSTSFEILYARGFRQKLDEPIYKDLAIANVTIKDPFMFTLLCFVSTLVCFKFNQYLKNRKRILKKRVSSNLPFCLKNLKIKTLRLKL